MLQLPSREEIVFLYQRVELTEKGVCVVTILTLLYLATAAEKFF